MIPGQSNRILVRLRDSALYRLRARLNQVRMMVAWVRPALRFGRQRRPRVVFLSSDPRQWKYSRALRNVCHHVDVRVFLVSGSGEHSPDSVLQSCPTADVRVFLNLSEALDALMRLAPSTVVIEQPKKYANFLKTNWRHRVIVIPYSVFMHRNPWTYRSNVLETVHGILAPYGARSSHHNVPRRLKSRILEVGLPVAEDIVGRVRGPRTPDAKTRIGWAPHWSIGEGKHATGTFLSSVAVIRDLVAENPDVQWVYRPHPGLQKHLKRNELPNMLRCRADLEQILSSPNVELSHGDPVDFLIDVDALIHDSVAFLAEFALTGKPTLYLLRDGRDYASVFSSSGLELLRHTNRCRADDGAILGKFVTQVASGAHFPAGASPFAKELLIPRDHLAIPKILMVKQSRLQRAKTSS